MQREDQWLYQVERVIDKAGGIAVVVMIIWALDKFANIAYTLSRLG